MAKRLRANIDIEGLMELIPEAPSLLKTFFSVQGKEMPPQMEKWAPVLGKAFEAGSKFVSFGPEVETGFDDSNGPDTGPLGKGRISYLRNKDIYSDEEVCAAFRMIWKGRSRYPEGIKTIRKAIDYTLDIMHPGVSLSGSRPPDDAQVRLAIDRVISGSALKEEISDKFGDMLLFTLENADTAKKENHHDRD